MLFYNDYNYYYCFIANIVITVTVFSIARIIYFVFFYLFFLLLILTLFFFISHVCLDPFLSFSLLRNNLYFIFSLLVQASFLIIMISIIVIIIFILFLSTLLVYWERFQRGFVLVNELRQYGLHLPIYFFG